MTLWPQDGLQWARAEHALLCSQFRCSRETQECLPTEGSHDALLYLLGGLLCQSSRLASSSKAILLGVVVRDRGVDITRACSGLALTETQCTCGDPRTGKCSWHLNISDNDSHHPPLPHTLPFPKPLNLSFKLCSQKWGLSWWRLLFNREVITLPNVSNTIFVIAKFLEITE